MKKHVVLILSYLTLAQCLNIISRQDWGARDPSEPSKPLAVNPPSHVVVHHSATAGCKTRKDCVRKVKAFQNYHMDTNGWNDIGYSFLIGEDGNVYEGQGWGKHAAHAPKLNAKSIGICLIGTFSNVNPNAAAFQTLKEFIAFGVTNKKIVEDYKLVGHRQVSNTECPGNIFYKTISGWPHFTEP